MGFRAKFRGAPVAPDPADIHVDHEARALVILWQDGHRSTYPFDLLRRECPCAMCDDMRLKQRQDPLAVISGPLLRPGEAEIEDWAPVGRYALNFTWNDGHSTGIYAFDFLRVICPCEACLGI